MILDPIAPSFLLVLVFLTCNRFGSKSRIPNFRYYDSQLIPFLLSTLRICFFHQKEVTWVLCLELRTSTSRTGCHAQVLFCSRPHDLLQSLLLDYTTSRLCSSEGPLIPDLMIPPRPWSLPQMSSDSRPHPTNSLGPQPHNLQFSLIADLMTPNYPGFGTQSSEAFWF